MEGSCSHSQRYSPGLIPSFVLKDNFLLLNLMCCFGNFLQGKHLYHHTISPGQEFILLILLLILFVCFVFCLGITPNCAGEVIPNSLWVAMCYNRSSQVWTHVRQVPEFLYHLSVFCLLSLGEERWGNVYDLN